MKWKGKCMTIPNKTGILNNKFALVLTADRVTSCLSQETCTAMGDAYKRSEINGNNPAPKRIKLINRSDTSVGINVIEIDGKSCNHEVAWPPGMFIHAQFQMGLKTNRSLSTTF